MELSQIEREKEESEKPLKSNVEMSEPGQNNGLSRKKLIFGTIAGVVCAIAISLVVYFSVGGDVGGTNQPDTVWTRKCFQCLNTQCNAGEEGISTQCHNGTVACISGSGEDYRNKRCGPLDRLTEGLIMNDCVERDGVSVCACNTDNCNEKLSE